MFSYLVDVYYHQLKDLTGVNYGWVIRRFVFFFVIGIVACLLCVNAFGNQIGATFSADTIGVLGDYEKALDPIDIAVDAQVQRSDNALSAALNGSVTASIGSVGIKPFLSGNKDDLGVILDAGALVNFSVGGLDIAGGASVRGVNPAEPSLEMRYDADNMEVEVYPSGYSPNSYQLPDINNINAVFATGFEKTKIETELTAYVPITERDSVPIVIISRSQTSIAIAENLSFSVVVDARTYLHSDGAEVSFKPLGAVTFKF